LRITAEAKTLTRERILETATALFKADGWDNTTTRGIASAAGIATGTLFNYFPTKEAIAATLIAEALQPSDDQPSAACPGENTEAALFTLIWNGLAKLRDFRTFLGPAAEAIFSPLARSTPDSPGDAIRVHHLERVDSILTASGFSGWRSAVAVQLYWTLYLGVFEFWAADDSPGQEDTLALLDQSLRLYVASLRINEGKGTNEHQ
jgi:AcrR family transcriptional regulator